VRLNLKILKIKDGILTASESEASG